MKLKHAGTILSAFMVSLVADGSMGPQQGRSVVVEVVDGLRPALFCVGLCVPD